jgi:ABC-type antimicrobial peptide transport system permease subunit
MLQVLLSLAFFLIIIACINFINLATAQSTQRAREIGMRKVMGGNRSSVIFQFLTETGVLVTFSVLASCLIATQLIPYVDRFFSTQVSQSIVWNTDMFMYVFILIVAVTILAGIYPAFILSGYNPMSAFSKHVTSFSGRGITLRKSMVVAQFLIAQMMVICMVIGAQQVKSFYQTDLGFNKDGIVTVNMIHRDSVLLQERFQQALAKYPEIKGMTYALTSPSSSRNWWWGNATNPALPHGEQNFRLQWVDDNYFEFYGIPLLAGRTFVETDSGSVALVNEEVVQAMGFANPEDVLGEKIIYWGSNPVTVIGVVKNYYSQGLKSEIPPHLYINGNWNFQLAQIKIDPLQSTIAIEHIKNEWTDLHPNNYFDYEFLSDDVNSFYEDERKLSNFIILFAVLSLTIGCLGLFGVVSFVCVRRTKEVSVRKVLGASITNILYLLSREFILLVIVAFAIAIPLGWYVMNEFLQRYTYHVDIHWSVFALAGAITLVIALFTVVLRSFRVALTNPADNLKCD